MPQVGERFLGTVVKTTAFGAFVSLLPGRDGLVHISKLGPKGKRIGKVEDVVSVGDKLQVEIAEIDARGKISLVPVDDDLRPPPDGRLRPPSELTRYRWRTRPALLQRPGTTRTLDRGPDGGAVRRTVLPGGLRVVTETMPGARSASFGVWVGVGSRDEAPSLAGASHYLEHLLFKGTARRAAAGDLVRAGRGRRRAQRVHLPGAHLLLRPRAGRGPAARGRRRLRRGRPAR